MSCHFCPRAQYPWLMILVYADAVEVDGAEITIL
jgi:hypothetical protein